MKGIALAVLVLPFCCAPVRADIIIGSSAQQVTLTECRPLHPPCPDRRQHRRPNCCRLIPARTARLALLLSRLFRMLLVSGHASRSFGSDSGQVAQIRYSFEGNQPGVLPQAVTTVWRTELGTTLSNGLKQHH